MCSTAEDLLRDLGSLVQEELKIVSYKWLSRQYQIPSNYAKRVLFRFVEQQGSKVKAIYLVSGYLKGDASSHVVRLVDASNLTACCGEFATQTSIHVHSVMPAEPHPVTDPGRLCAEDMEQARHFYNALLQCDTADGSADVLARNSCSSVKFSVNIVPAAKQQQQRPLQQNQQDGSRARQLDTPGDGLKQGKENGAAAGERGHAAAGDAGQPPAKKQKGSSGSFKLDPLTGEEIWEDDEPEQPAAAAPAVAAAAAAGGVASSGNAAGSRAGAVGGGSKAVGGKGVAGKGSKRAAGGKGGQKNIMSFFGKK